LGNLIRRNRSVVNDDHDRAGAAARLRIRSIPTATALQGKANEPITVAGILDRAHKEADSDAIPDWSLEAIYDRLEQNAPRIAIIGGSPDHPAISWTPGPEPALRSPFGSMAACPSGSPCPCSATAPPRATWA